MTIEINDKELQLLLEDGVCSKYKKLMKDSQLRDELAMIMNILGTIDCIDGLNDLHFVDFESNCITIQGKRTDCLLCLEVIDNKIIIINLLEKEVRKVA